MDAIGKAFRPLVVSATQMIVYVLKWHSFSRANKPNQVNGALTPEGSLFYRFNPLAGIRK